MSSGGPTAAIEAVSISEVQWQVSLSSLREGPDVPETEADLACPTCRCPKSGDRAEPNVREAACHRTTCVCHADVHIPAARSSVVAILRLSAIREGTDIVIRDANASPLRARRVLTREIDRAEDLAPTS